MGTRRVQYFLLWRRARSIGRSNESCLPLWWRGRRGLGSLLRTCSAVSHVVAVRRNYRVLSATACRRVLDECPSSVILTPISSPIVRSGHRWSRRSSITWLARSCVRSSTTKRTRAWLMSMTRAPSSNSSPLSDRRAPLWLGTQRSFFSRRRHYEWPSTRN